MKTRPVWLSSLLIVMTLLAGVVVRFAHLGLPGAVKKYGGSMLWALLIYWLFSSLPMRRPVLRATGLAVTLASSIEFFKLYNPPAVDAFRRTLPGVLVLGRLFSWWDILAYWMAIALGALIDERLRRRSV